LREASTGFTESLPENILELKRFRDGSLNRELNRYFNKRYPDYRSQGDPFDQFARHQVGRWEIGLEEILRWIHTHPHVTSVTPEWNTVFAYMTREILNGD